MREVVSRFRGAVTINLLVENSKINNTAVDCQGSKSHMKREADKANTRSLTLVCLETWVVQSHILKVYSLHGWTNPLYSINIWKEEPVDGDCIERLTSSKPI